MFLSLLLKLLKKQNKTDVTLLYCSVSMETRCFCEAYTGLPVVRVTENQKALNCVVLKYIIPVSEE